MGLWVVPSQKRNVGGTYYSYTPPSHPLSGAMVPLHPHKGVRVAHTALWAYSGRRGTPAELIICWASQKYPAQDAYPVTPFGFSFTSTLMAVA